MFENYAFCGVGTLLSHARVSYIERKRDVTYITSQREATSGLEPLVQLLQSRALPLGDVAALRYGERETGIEPATFSLARRCSTTEPLPLMPFATLTLLYFCNPVYVIKISYSRRFVNRFFAKFSTSSVGMGLASIRVPLTRAVGRMDARPIPTDGGRSE